MSDDALDGILKDQQVAIISAVSAKMRGDHDMAKVAEQRRLSEGDLSEQVLGFWLQAIRSDLALGSTDAMEQNMQWLPRLREGHSLPFADEAVRRCFTLLSDEIESRLGSDVQRDTYGEYRRDVDRLIGEAFPESKEA